MGQDQVGSSGKWKWATWQSHLPHLLGIWQKVTMTEWKIWVDDSGRLYTARIRAPQKQKLQGLYPWLSSYRNTQKTKNKILNLLEFPANKDLYSSILRGIFLLLVKANIYWVLLCAWHCSKSFTWIDSFTPTVLYNRCYYYPRFADKETEPQDHSAPKWRSQDWTREMWFLSLNLQPPCCTVSVLKWKGNPTGS